MKAIRYRVLALIIAFCSASQAQSAQKSNVGSEGKADRSVASGEDRRTGVGWKCPATERHADLHA